MIKEPLNIDHKIPITWIEVNVLFEQVAQSVTQKKNNCPLAFDFKMSI
ncbi:MAG TPA: hypothetical protein VE622_04460 [Nitrososphaeraceae archaeon]|nr:hypothetical protein [Nitrososphaeraceae archaeon]